MIHLHKIEALAFFLFFCVKTLMNASRVDVTPTQSAKTHREHLIVRVVMDTLVMALHAQVFFRLQTSDFRLQTSDFRDIYLNRIAEKVNQYLSGCVPVDEKYGT